MPRQLGPLKSRKKKRSCKTSRTVSLQPTVIYRLQLSVFTFDWNFTTFPRVLQPGFDPLKGLKCPRGRQRAVKQALTRRDAPASAVNACGPPAGGDAPPLRRLKDARAKKMRTGTPAA